MKSDQREVFRALAGFLNDFAARRSGRGAFAAHLARTPRWSSRPRRDRHVEPRDRLDPCAQRAHRASSRREHSAQARAVDARGGGHAGDAGRADLNAPSTPRADLKEREVPGERPAAPQSRRPRPGALERLGPPSAACSGTAVVCLSSLASQCPGRVGKSVVSRYESGQRSHSAIRLPIASPRSSCRKCPAPSKEGRARRPAAARDRLGGASREDRVAVAEEDERGAVEAPQRLAHLDIFGAVGWSALGRRRPPGTGRCRHVTRGVGNGAS